MFFAPSRAHPSGFFLSPGAGPAHPPLLPVVVRGAGPDDRSAPRTLPSQPPSGNSNALPGPPPLRYRHDRPQGDRAAFPRPKSLTQHRASLPYSHFAPLNMGPKSAGKTSNIGDPCLLMRAWRQGIGQASLDRGESGTDTSHSLSVARLHQSRFSAQSYARIWGWGIRGVTFRSPRGIIG